MRQSPRPRVRRRVAGPVLAAVVAATLAVTGCSIQIKAAPDPSLGDDTMLVAADTGSPTFQRNFNPYLPSARVSVTYLYEPLVVLDPISGRQVPWLAEKVAQPDARTIRFTIRPGVTWSDGQPLTAADVEFTFALLKKHAGLDGRGVWAVTDSVERDGDTIVVHLKGDDSPALQTIEQTLIVPEHIWKDVADPETWTNPHPVGSGPFTLGRFTPQQYALDKNPSYWQADKVAPEHLVLPASNTQLDVATKGYDWAYAFVTDVNGTWVKADPETNTYWFPPAGTISLFPNHTKKPFNDLDFRQGLSLALDRARIGDVAAEGYMDPAGQSGLLLPNQEAALDPSLPDKGAIEQDTKAALEHFGKAGYTRKGDALVGPDGKKLTITLMTANGYSDWLKGAQEIQRELGAIGIEVKLSQPQPAAYSSSLAAGDYELALGGVGGTGSVFSDFDTNLSGDRYVPVGKKASGNLSRYKNAEVDRILAQYRSTVDPAEQKQLGYRLQRIFYDDLPTISLWYGGSWGLFSTRKFTGWPSKDDPYASPQPYGNPLGTGSSPLLVLTHLKPAKEDG